MILISLFAFFETTPGYCSSSVGETINLPLGLYLSRDNFDQIKAYYASGRGDADRFDIKHPEKYFGHIQWGLKETRTTLSKAYKRPKGLYHISSCAFCYAITGNIEAGNSVKEMLMLLSGFDNWHIKGKTAPFEESFIVRQMVVCTDLIYSLLSDQERDLIARAIEKNGLRPIKDHVIGRHHWTTKDFPYRGGPGFLQYSNQGPTYLGALYLGSRLLYHHTGYEKYREDYLAAANAIHSLIRKYFPDDGSVTAATGYYLRTLLELSYIIQPMAKSLGMSMDEFLPPGAKNPYLFSLYLRSNAVPKGVDPAKTPMLINFGDSSYNSIIYDPYTRKSLGNNYFGLAVWSAHVGDPALQWMHNTYTGGFKFNESAVSLVSHYYRDLLTSDLVVAEPRLEKEKLFSRAGLFIWRDGWNQGDKLFALNKRVFYQGDHLNHDQNTFLLEAFGERYFTDLGVNYKLDKIRGLSSSVHHNTITINGQKTKDGRNRREIRPYLTTHELNFARSDSSYYQETEPLPKLRNGYTAKEADKMIRTVMYLKPDYYVIGDTVHCKAKATIQSNFVSACPFTVKENRVIYSGRASSLFQFLVTSAPVQLKQAQLLDDRSKPAYGLKAETQVPVTQASFLNILYPTGDHLPPVVTKEVNLSGIAVKIHSNDREDHILQKGVDQETFRIDDIESDCEYIVIRRQNGRITCLGFFEGSFLNIDDQAVLETDKTASMIINVSKSNISGEAVSPENTYVQFSFFKKPIALTLSDTDENGYSTFASLRM